MTRDELTEAVRQAIEALPMSRREIARRAGLAHTTLNRIAHGQQRATPEIARAVAGALEEVADKVGSAGDRILQRRTTPKLARVLGHGLEGLAGEVGSARSRILTVLDHPAEDDR